MGMNESLVERIKRLSAPLEPIATGVDRRLHRLPGIRAVIFDVYGTLFVSGSGDVGTAVEVGRAEALTEALAAAGFPRPSDGCGVRGAELLHRAIQAHHEIERAGGIEQPEVEIRAIWRTVWGELAGPGGLPDSPGDEQVETLAVEYECRVNPCWPMPGAGEVLKTLSGRGFALGIVSNAQFYTPLMFRALLGAEPGALGCAAHRCVWSYRIGAAKPSPELFASLSAGLEEDGLAAGECLYVGNDMLNDVYAASRAGLKTALFAGDRRSLRLREADPRCSMEPDVVVTQLKDLEEVLP
jgi:putative hydrolase of the HAD superfamily